MSKKKELRVYDIVFQIASDCDEAEVLRIFSLVKDEAEKLGRIIDIEDPEIMDLAYTMNSKNKNSEGRYERYDTAFFSSVKFEAAPSSAIEIRNLLHKTDSIIRFLVLETIEGNTRIGDALYGEEPVEEEILA